MNTLTVFALSTILKDSNSDNSLKAEITLLEVKNIEDSEVLIGVSAPLSANSEDISDDVYIA